MTATPAIDHLAALHAHQERFLADLRVADLTVRVPWCGRWRVSDLAEHLARIHHWAAAQAGRTREVPLGRGPFDVVDLYDRCAAELRDVLAGLDPDARASTLLDDGVLDDGVPRAEQRGTVRFWHRRQCLETLVHLWDLRTALGLPFEPGAAAWHDCLDEVVGVMHPRQVRLGRVPAPDLVVDLVATDAPALRIGSRGATDDTADAVVTGPARALALLAWGRADLEDDGVEVAGDVDGVRRLLAAGLTP